ncbi:pectinesterase [Marchantia polymorpha subsp. ruderalis]|uniref:Pectinesterase n=2 Tax=Marchantia polymorpha TaxID=3197 RepID=A0A176VVN6_MARPO|nr:hypothetical protein AXG93_2931s1060 [Marchantia polymorpha subsp. ruderalis]PTQ42683.1 hypothetical protein MARPO_0028s0010 [Marchantia polymorpha]BBN00713.1 hypothetical protein Mp_2g01420 [Marchantia polymorpha subsp. ruderalis]|eukprot:PTQ42683.1 hypothetical protein MARPO_0028s0010 [Marchantia polymorpha]
MAGRQVFVCLLLALVAVAAQGASVDSKNGKSWTDEEIEKEMMDWIDRMGKKEESKVHAPKINVNFATSKSSPAPAPASRIIVVDRKGKGDYRTLKKAIKAIPNGDKERWTIKVNPGVYKERVKIPKEKGPITLLGSGHHKTKITYNLNAEKAGGTLKSASVSVKSDHFIAKDISFENTSPAPKPGAVGQQAVAFEISGDKAAFYRCVFLGYQDTLYDRYGRHYFKDCRIRGSIDYIFGNGQSYYEKCTLESVAETFGSLTAQKRMTKKEETGYSFVDCKVKGTGYLYLSRAWGPYSRVVFIRTYFDDIIRPEGWYNWGIPGREKTVFYGEYKCFGPGANRQGREQWSYNLTAKQAKPFMTVDWIDGKDWLPKGRQ